MRFNSAARSIVFSQVGDGLRRILANAAHLEQLPARGGQHRRRIAEMLEQLAYAHRPTALIRFKATRASRASIPTE